MSIKTIGVLTSGGDAPGMNATLRAVVRSGIGNGFHVMGIKKGYHGLLRGDMEEMTLRSVSDIINRGGTILQTARSTEFMTKEGITKAIDICKVFSVDVIVVIGGDGSFRGAKDLCDAGMPVIGIPGTIDNDIGCTDYTIGFDTALNTVKDAVDKIRDTAFSHERCSVVEVMGRHAGYIALNVALATGAEVALIPERDFDLNSDIIKPIIEGRNRGKKHYIVIVAEGVGRATEIATDITKMSGVEARATVLGHIQRGGSPTARDRVMAGIMGGHAVDLLKEGKVNRIVAMQKGRVTDMDIKEALQMKKDFDDSLMDLNKLLAL